MVTSKRDSLSGAPVGIDITKHHVHDGNMYQVGVTSTALANDGWLSLATPNPCGGQMHFTFNGSLDGTCQIDLLEGSSYAMTGTTTSTATAYNMHRGKGDFPAKMIKNSSAISSGTTPMSVVLPGGSKTFSAGMAGGTRTGLHWITDPTKNYLMRITNKAGAAKAASLEVNFDVHTAK